MIQPVVPMVAPSLLRVVVLRGWCATWLQDEHDNEDDDQDECSNADADTHDCLLPWCGRTCVRPWSVARRENGLGSR